MKRSNPESTERAKLALMQILGGVVMTVVSLGFKSIVVFFVSLIVIGMGINNVIKMVKEVN